MLLWFKEFVTAAGIDASLWNTVTQCAIGACVCEWNMSHSASVNRSDSPVTLLYTACYVTRDARFFIRTLNILFFGVFWLSAGSAGDWFSDGEEGDGAQTRNHSAEGEFLYLFFSDWPNKNCLVLWDEMLEQWMQKTERKGCKKVQIVGVTGPFSASASEELLLRFCQCADRLLLFTFTHTHLTLPWIWEPLHACLSLIYLCDRKGLRPSGWFEVIHWLALAGWTPSGSMNQTGCERAHISPPGSQSATWPSASVVTGGGIRPGQLGSVWLIPSNKVQALI